LSIQDQIRALEKLAQIDAELKELQEQLSQERATLSGLKSGIAKLDDKLAVDRAALAAMDKTRGELIQDVRNMSQQLDHSREKLSRSRTERESNAAQRELEELRKLVRDREDEIGKLSADGETARVAIEATEADHGKLAADLGAREGDISSKVGEVSAKETAKIAERELAVKALPAQLYRRYDIIRSKRGTALAQTRDGTCQACHMALPPQLFHRLRREPILEQCPSCNRIIYFVAAAAPEQPAASASPERS
jgi:predicted  nucleic acid-binding Zn-ribbon protein